MNPLQFRKALRKAHEATARALAERQALQLAGQLPPADADAYWEQVAATLGRAIVASHRERGIPISFDDIMLIFALEAFTERLLELVSVPGFGVPANDVRRH